MSIKFENILIEYLNAADSLEMAEMVLNSNVERAFVSNFSFWINQNKSINNKQIISVTELNCIDHVIIFLSENVIEKIIIVEYGHKFNYYEKKRLKKSIDEKFSKDLSKLLKKIQSLKNTFGLTKINKNILVIYHCNLITELKSYQVRDLCKNLIIYKGLYLKYSKYLTNINNDLYKCTSCLNYMELKNMDKIGLSYSVCINDLVNLNIRLLEFSFNENVIQNKFKLLKFHSNN